MCGLITDIDEFLNSSNNGQDLYGKCNLNWENGDVHLQDLPEDYDDKSFDTMEEVDELIEYNDVTANNRLIKGILYEYKHDPLNIAEIVRSRFMKKWYKMSSVFKPLLITIQKKKFEKLPEDYSGIKGSKEVKSKLQHNLQNPFSFLNNSSIWIRLVNNGNSTESEKERNEAKNEFQFFKDIGLYSYDNAKEFLEYNLRLQEHNYLKEMGGGNHGSFVTPILYGNEVKALEELLINNVPLIKKNSFIEGSYTVEITDCDKKNSFSVKIKGGTSIENEDETKKSFKFLNDFHDIAFRILLLDDKIGCEEDNRFITLIHETTNEEQENEQSNEKNKIEVKSCKDCNENECKLRTIKLLMDDGEHVRSKIDIFDGIGVTKDYFYWKEKDIETFYCPTIIHDFIEDENIQQEINVYPDKPRSDSPEQMSRDKAWKKYKNNHSADILIRCHFAPEIDRNNPKVQIVGVKDVRTALLLLSRFKFDMVFCDYLLDKKENCPGKREYSNPFFNFLSTNLNKEIEKNLKDSTSTVVINKRRVHLQSLNKLRNTVLDNRGPLDKLWIMPITGFNQTFIHDLYRNHINLIDYKWNICNGADPINTPWQFLYHLNKFIELQLKSSVYKKRKLMTFLQYTGEDLEVYLINGNGERPCFEEFQQFMGAEYANFMKRYGARKLIERDAATADGDNSNKSMFATYINKKFYNEPNYYIETELNQLMQHFYHQAATMFDERYGRQRLREAFERMRVFVAYNKLENEISDTKEKGKLIRGLRFIHTVIDSEFNREIINNWIKENPKTE